MCSSQSMKCICPTVVPPIVHSAVNVTDAIPGVSTVRLVCPSIIDKNFNEIPKTYGRTGNLHTMHIHFQYSVTQINSSSIWHIFLLCTASFPVYLLQPHLPQVAPSCAQCSVPSMESGSTWSTALNLAFSNATGFSCALGFSASCPCSAWLLL